MAVSQPDCIPTSKNAVLDAVLSEKPRNELERLVNAGNPWKLVGEDCETILHTAAKIGHSEGIEYFVSIGADVNAKDQNGLTPIFYAALWAEENVISIINTLIGHGAHKMELDSDGGNLLMASVTGHQPLTVLESLIKIGFSYDIVNRDGYSILDYAVMEGNFAALQLFLEKGVNVQHKTNLGLSLLHVAANFESLNFRAIVKLLSKKGVDIHELAPCGCNMILFGAAQFMSVENLKWLVGLGVKSDISDENGNTALHHAVEVKHLEALKYFISEGLNPEKENKAGETPLDLAESYQNNPDIYKEMHKILEGKFKRSETSKESSVRDSSQAGPSGRKVSSSSSKSSCRRVSLPRTSLTRKSLGKCIELKYREDWRLQNETKEVEKLSEEFEKISLGRPLSERYVDKWMKKVENMPSFSSLE